MTPFFWQAAKAAGNPYTGNFGSTAHKKFELLLDDLNGSLKGTGVEVKTEQFRTPVKDARGNIITGELTSRNTAGSKSLDAVIYQNGTPIKGLDLKTYIDRLNVWKPSEVNTRQKLFDSIPIEQIPVKRARG